MSAFSTIDVARTGVGFAHYWMDTVAHNVANIGTVTRGDEEPFRARMVVAQQVAGGGVGVGQVVEAAGDPTRVLDPENPMADAQGYVTMPMVDLAGQMTDLMIANRSYQANLRVVENGREAYASALRLGQR